MSSFIWPGENLPVYHSCCCVSQGGNSFCFKKHVFFKTKTFEGGYQVPHNHVVETVRRPRKTSRQNKVINQFFFEFFFPFPILFFRHFCCICHLIDSSHSQFHRPFRRCVTRGRCVQACVVTEHSLFV